MIDCLIHKDEVYYRDFFTENIFVLYEHGELMSAFFLHYKSYKGNGHSIKIKSCLIDECIFGNSKELKEKYIEYFI